MGLGPETNDNCPDPSHTTLPDSRGIFDPIQTTDDYTLSPGLGLWKPYFYQFSGTKIILHHNGYFYPDDAP